MGVIPFPKDLHLPKLASLYLLKFRSAPRSHPNAVAREKGLMLDILCDNEAKPVRGHTARIFGVGLIEIVHRI